jgi:hypothetical protein
VAITWTKEWKASDDGTIVSGLDLKNIQDDITSGSTGDATSLWSVPIIQPTAADDGKVVFYDHSSPAFDYLNVSTIIPTGVILLWSGAISAIPSGWALCDGTAGTPNLTDRFVIHADADSGGTRDVGDTGGSHTTNLQHQHSTTTGGPSSTVFVDDNSGGTDYNVGSQTHTHTGTSNNQLSTAESTIPAFYALAYIMKT